MENQEHIIENTQAENESVLENINQTTIENNEPEQDDPLAVQWKHTCRILEYDDVVEIIARKTTNLYGREFVKNRRMMDDPIEISEIQAETAESIRIFESTDSFTVGELYEIRPFISLAVKGVALQAGEILKVYETAKIARLLKKYLSTREVLAYRLREKSAMIETCPDFENAVKNSIDTDGKILDKASPRLNEIRKTLNTLNNRIHSQLDQFLKDPNLRGMLQEPIITKREHRYVVPVKQEYRTQFPGLVLDSSSSGATLFMEPLSVLKMTNELKFQDSEEKREEERIRLKLSQMVAVRAEDILRNLEFLGYFDSLQACARFYTDFRCTLPRITDKPLLELHQARHPLLGKKAVPIDVRIGEDFKGLIITGPNTGGKTVTLKTVGLQVMLALSGFPIPSADGSRVGVYTRIFADIGDEQSISQNLSTFSSHITQIIRMINLVNDRTLILLDEIGAGTDPSEGVALGSSLLMHFINKKAHVFVTTHYNELKYFASHNEQFRNAAVEFDEETLMPTYKIDIGLPGRSCALKIASRLGLADIIIKESEKILGAEYMEMDSLLSEIDLEKTKAKQESEEAEARRKEMEKLREDYERRLKAVEEEKRQIIERTMEEGRQFIDEVFRELREARKDWRKSHKDFKKGEKEQSEVKQDEDKVRSKLEESLKRLKSMQVQQEQEREETEEKGPAYKDGDLVMIATMGQRGRIVQILDKDAAMVQVGSIKMEIPFINLEPVDLDLTGHDEFVSGIKMKKALSVSNRIDVRGMRVEEVFPILSKHIDDANLGNLASFQIVHGKGTGALRKGIHDYLRSHSGIKSFRDGELHEGGWGVTVVEL
ncbi:MAG: endonuclease MutS2 [Firmicutes bacterium]|nr:endonuclease MutS2 [Bacillota bacterium]